MKDIDICKWKRKSYYEYYRNYDNPCFSLSVNIDITMLIEKINEKRLKFFPVFLYVLMAGINEIDELKYRIRNDQVVLHDSVSPSFTVLNDSENYVFCYVEFNQDFKTFYNEVLKNIKMAIAGGDLVDEEGKDDLVFISSLPWISFSGINHPFSKNDPHSIPRVTFGKYYQESNSYLLPFHIQVHHGLCDGLHISKLIEKIKEIIISF